jgi:hypothetical protein
MPSVADAMTQPAPQHHLNIASTSPPTARRHLDDTSTTSRPTVPRRNCGQAMTRVAEGRDVVAAAAQDLSPKADRRVMKPAPDLNSTW